MEVEEKITKSERNTEKRKEKSRYAAKCRRNRESEIFSSLAQVLPLKESCIYKLDKATIMRLGIAHLRIRNFFSKTFPSIDSSVLNEYDKLSMVALGGIILVLTVEGDIVYVSNNVSVYLGISQIELLGQNVFDISHPCDHKEMKDILSGKHEKEGNFSLFMRFKCSLTNKGLNYKLATYKVLHIIGTMMRSDGSNPDIGHHFTAIGSPIPHPANIETPLGSYLFLSKHSLDMKFTYADERMKHFLGYSPDNLIGKSFYEFHHVLDNNNIQNAFKSLFSKGQSETDHYRFLVKGGGFVWVYTQATIIYSERGSKPESVVCLNYVVSEKLNESEIYSINQLDEFKVSAAPTVNKPIPSTSKVLVKISSPDETERPQLATCKIFATRTPEMNKEFLTFDDADSGCTNEPDLTHLAPTAGDVCISLETSPCNSYIVDKLSSPVCDEFSPLLHSKKSTKFFVPSADDTPGTSSPALSKSPGAPSLPPPCSVREEPSPYEDLSVKSFLTFDSNDNNSDYFSFIAPYISMTEVDDLPLFMNADFWPTTYSNCPSEESSCSTPPVPVILLDESMYKSLRNNPTIQVESFQNHEERTSNPFQLHETICKDCPTLTDEPDDLTHLAPNAGDGCISLETSPCNGSIVEELNSSVSDGFSPLLHCEKNTKFFVPSMDDTSRTLSPALSKSPGASSLPSSCSAREEPSSYEDSSIKSFLSFDSNDNNSDDFSFKAPYISMTEGDDLPLFLNADFWPTTYSNCPSVESSCSTHPVPEILLDENKYKSLRNNATIEIESFQDHGDGTSNPFQLHETLLHDCHGENDTRKRCNLDIYSSNLEIIATKKRKQQDIKNISADQCSSVLMNLLVAGHDVNAGYVCINTRKKISPDKHSEILNNS